MPAKRFKRRIYFIETELQFWFVVILISVVSVEGIFIGYGMSRLLSIASQWQRTNMALDFFITLIVMLAVLIGVNFALGIYLSHKIAGPIYKLRKVMEEMKKGNLSHAIQTRPGDMLKNFVMEFNDTISKLNKLIHRDRGFVQNALEKLDQCQEILKGKNSAGKIREVQKMILGIKSLLVIVNTHFTFHSGNVQKEKRDDTEKDNSNN
jgi:methyl-accepting chemotaxis protein